MASSATRISLASGVFYRDNGLSLIVTQFQITERFGLQFSLSGLFPALSRSSRPLAVKAGQGSFGIGRVAYTQRNRCLIALPAAAIGSRPVAGIDKGHLVMAVLFIRPRQMVCPPASQGAYQRACGRSSL